MLLVLKVEYLHELLGILQHGRFVSSPCFQIYSVTYLYQYGLTHIYFIIWIIIQYYFIYFIAQIVLMFAS